MIHNVVTLASWVVFISLGVWMLSFILSLGKMLRQSDGNTDESKTAEVVDAFMDSDYGAALRSVSGVSKWFAVLGAVTWLVSFLIYLSVA